MPPDLSKLKEYYDVPKVSKPMIMKMNTIKMANNESGINHLKIIKKTDIKGIPKNTLPIYKNTLAFSHKSEENKSIIPKDILLTPPS